MCGWWELALGGGEGMGRAQGEGVLDEAVKGAWEEKGKGKEVVEGWERLCKALGKEGKV